MRPRRIARTPRSQYRELRRESDGGLYDVNERRRVSNAEVRDDIQAGRRFRAVHHDTGADCTSQVLGDILRGALAEKAGFGTGLPSGLASIASTLLSALDNGDEGHTGTARRGRWMRAGNALPGGGDEPSAPGRG